MGVHQTGTVFVVDDDPSMQRLLAAYVESAGLRCEPYATALTFLDAIDVSRPGCVVADYKMPGMSGLELQDALAQRGALLPVIMVTGHGTIPIAVRAMKSRAVDVLEKPFNGEELLCRIDEALQLNLQRRYAESRRAEAGARFRRLTEREREVMCLVVSGLANKQISRRLHVSEKTVEAHRGHMMKKLGVACVAELVRLALTTDGSATAVGVNGESAV